MACPDENTLVALVHGEVASEARPLVARHLDECSSCRQTVASLIRLAAGPESDEAHAATIASERPPPMSRTGVAPGDVVGGRYRLDRIVGEGGLGVVWAATHAITQRSVALKILKFRDPSLDKRFLREARLSGILRHPSIVDVHDVFELEHDGALVMVMDLLEGESLDRRLTHRGALPLRETLHTLYPVFSALAAAHALGVVHRDLKPQNIFLAHGANGERAMLLDFGLAKLTATEGAAAQTSVLTREKSIMGTPHYMAPEQLYGEMDIDARTDVWAIAAVVYECLSGRRPVEGDTVGQILRSLAMRDIPPIENLVQGLPPEFSLLLGAMLARDRQARPPGVAPLITLSERILSAR
jgi:serine/threonine-protein kinase